MLTSVGGWSAEPNSRDSQLVAVDPTSRLDVDSIRARIEQVAARTDISSSERDLVLEQLKAALARVESANAARAQSAEFAQSLRDAPEVIRSLRAALDKENVAPAAPAVVGSGDLVDLRLRLASLQTQAVTLRGQQRALDESLRLMSTRSVEARRDLLKLRQDMDDNRSSIASNASSLQVEATRLRVEASRQDLSVRIELIEQEILSLPTREAITTAQRDLSARRLQRMEVGISALTEQVNLLRREEAKEQEQKALEAERLLASQPEQVRDFASETATIHAGLTELQRALDATRTDQVAIRARTAAVNESKRNAEQIFGIGRVSEEYVRLLRRLSRDLPSAGKLEASIESRNSAIIDVRIDRFNTEQALRDIEGSDLAPVNVVASDTGLSKVRTDRLLKELLDSRRTALREVRDAQAHLIESLSETNALEAELLNRSALLRMLLDERLLWLPSAHPIGAAWWTQVGQGLRWLVAPSSWLQIFPALFDAFKSHGLALAVLLGLALSLFLMRARLTRRLRFRTRQVGSHQDSFGATFESGFVSLLLALPGPIALMSIGWALGAVVARGSFVAAVGQGLVNAGIGLWMLDQLSVLSRPDGLLIGHFRWNAERTGKLRRALVLLILAMLPILFLGGMLHGSGNQLVMDGIGRLTTVAVSVVLAVFLYRIFRPDGGAFTSGLSREGFAWRSRRVWIWPLAGTPLALAILALAGYTVTSAQLLGRLFTSGWVALLFIIVYYIAMRGIRLIGVRAARAQAVRRRANRAASQQAQAEADASGEALPLLQDDEDLDVASVSQQTQALLRAIVGLALAFALWNIWSDLIPAFGVFNDTVLWSNIVVGVAGNTVSAVTLGDLLLGILVAALTVLAARNVPGFMEIAVLGRFSIDSGTRYAIVTIARYCILAIGIVVAFNWIGADWSQLQWIIAALGVGLGFGLQEIVANFVSGIIILFERPVRVGDTVSIGGTTGTVSRINIRAITITDPDNFEVLIPNKAFITQPVQNWSLTSPLTRLVVKVGVAYGSDVEQVRHIMLEVAGSNAQVLESPTPTVLFLGFGDSSLNLELRVFVGRIEHRMSTLHELHLGLDKALKAAGIEIPFPQRDLHIISGGSSSDGPTLAMRSDRSDASSSTGTPAGDVSSSGAAHHPR